jgi:cell division protein FtsZ
MRNQTKRILLGKQKLRGSGSGGDPQVGKIAVEESVNEIRTILQDTDVLFIVAGLGKGTGSGASPEIAKLARELGVLTIAIVNFPSISAEGQTIYKNALENFGLLKKEVDSLTIISNDKIIKNNHQQEISFMEAFARANNEVVENIDEITQLINNASEMNIDFADVKHFFHDHSVFMSSVMTIPNEYTRDSLAILIKNSIDHSCSDVNINNQPKRALINLLISAKTPTSIVADIRSTLRKITNNNELSVTFGIDYAGKENIKMTYIIAADDQVNLQTNVYEEPIHVDMPSADKVEDFFTTSINLDMEEYKTCKVAATTSIGIKKEAFNVDELTSKTASEQLNSTDALILITKAITGVAEQPDSKKYNNNN